MMTRVPILLLVLATWGHAEDWPQWRGPARDGLTSGPVPSSWPETLRQRWRLRVGEGHASPIVSDSLVFQFSRDGEGEVLRAINLRSGALVWEQAYDAPYRVNSAASGHGKGPKSTPVLHAGTICTLGIDGMLACRKSQTGRLLWQKHFRALSNDVSHLRPRHVATDRRRQARRPCRRAWPRGAHGPGARNGPASVGAHG